MATTIGQETSTAEEPPPPPAPEPTTPTKPIHHGTPQRGVDVIPSSSFKTGRFGRMFRHLPVFAHTADDMTALALRMVEPAGPPPENPDIPSGYTYFGQFVDHDVTFDPVSSLRRQNDPDALHNFRTPRFDLDSLYGRGPADQPYLYDDSGPVTKMRLGEDVGVVPGETSGAGPDLPRNEPRQRAGEEVFFGRALTGDPRNDENLLVSQLHLTMLQFHNRVADVVGSTTPLTGDDAFKETQRLVRWHYQWVVVHDFLRRIVGQAVIDDILRTETYVADPNGSTIALIRPSFQFYRPANTAYIPVEFAVAAYRFGHSMIRGRYDINDFVKNARGDQGPIPIFGPELPPDELSNLNGFRRLPPQWAVEWKFLVDMPGADTPPQPSLPIDTKLARPLADLPLSVAAHPPHALAERNLQRGVALGLPAGNTVARAMGIDPLDADTLGIGDLSEDLRMHPPLWFYILKEAEVLAAGKTLGPVGGRIVAEVLLGMLNEDPLSYLSVEPNWKPQAPMARDDGTFDLPQLLRFAKEA
ncbi:MULTISPECIES: peroxidase family protein [Mumia]|uniref:peroxidase family protein n=1 Tax=Mumia TaxID=1546255 RepID=UPI00141F7AAB|nr:MULTISPECIES: heme peroxidase family protein [unclassified Mumia]QMW68086.1 peroxidase [Mumia sp. ZJ1417]